MIAKTVQFCSVTERKYLTAYLQYLLSTEGELVKSMLKADESAHKLLGSDAFQKREAVDCMMDTSMSSLLGQSVLQVHRNCVYCVILPYTGLSCKNFQFVEFFCFADYRPRKL